MLGQSFIVNPSFQSNSPIRSYLSASKLGELFHLQPLQLLPNNNVLRFGKFLNVILTIFSIPLKLIYSIS